jgi:myosin heavy chain 9/10/11/14
LLSEAQQATQEAKNELSSSQSESGKLRQELSSLNRDLEERTTQLLLFQRSIGVLPRNPGPSESWDDLKAQTLKNVDLAKRLEETTLALQVMEEAKAAVERRLQNASNWRDDFDQPSRPQWRTMDDVARAKSRDNSPLRSLPSRLHERTGSISSLTSISKSDTDSNGSDDISQRKYTQSLRTQIEDLTTRLELSELQRRRLERGPTHSRQNSTEADSLELRRLQRENSRLHDLVDEQAEKLSGSPASKNPKEIRSPHGMLDSVKALEQAKAKLNDQQNTTLRELTKARAELDKTIASNKNTDREVNALRQRLDVERTARQAEQKTYQKTLTELKTLKIRMEGNSGKVAEMEDVIKIHKSRTEDLQNRLEEAEIAAHNAMRSESYARGQLQEVEEALTAALNEQRKAEDNVITLQKELRVLEGKVSLISQRN